MTPDIFKNRSRHWLWIGGWGIMPDSALAVVSKALPDSIHHWIYPGPDWEERMDNLQMTLSPSVICGYSLGSLLLLERLVQKPEVFPKIPVYLFAPFLAFDAAREGGGRIKAAQVKLVLRQLRKDPHGALAEFYQVAGIRLVLPPKQWCLSHLAELEWGLECLAHRHVTLRDNLKTEVLGCIGKADTILDADEVISLLPGIQLDPQSGHCLCELLASQSVASFVKKL